MRFERGVRCLGAVIAIAVIVGDGPDGHTLAESVRTDSARGPLRDESSTRLGKPPRAATRNGCTRSGPATGGGGCPDRTEPAANALAELVPRQYDSA
jgi:hypothetical protein